MKIDSKGSSVRPGETINLSAIQSHRDYFEAHTYARIDAKGKFHTKWEKP